ncbi:MAG TPA: chemotaxis protein CheD [Firmicutes bacterium]|nr:chemotaxis protein CheD [Bacillota bacterium]
MIEEIVRTGEIKVISREGCLTALGVGSCVALVLYDPGRLVAGMAHIFLPFSGNGHKSAMASSFLPAKFADTAVEALHAAILKCGASTGGILAKMAGGANLFDSFQGQALDVGKLNGEAVKKALSEMGIPVTGATLGGNFGRTVRFYLPSMRMKIVCGFSREASI